MDERPCIRGCVYRDNGDPAPALHGALICEYCMHRLRVVLTDAPDLCAHLRSQMDPQKAQTYDGEKLGGKPSSESQPPMSADLVDAADFVLTTLIWWAGYFGDPTGYRRHADGYRSNISIEQAYGVANWAATFLLSNLESTIANDSMVRLFGEAVLGPKLDPDAWTIAKALRRWSMKPRGVWAKESCPTCDLRTVMIYPPRGFGDDPRFVCQNTKCTWAASKVELAIWSEYFGVPLHIHRWEHTPDDGTDGGAAVFRCDCGSLAVDTTPAPYRTEMTITRKAFA